MWTSLSSTAFLLALSTTSATAFVKSGASISRPHLSHAVGQWRLATVPTRLASSTKTYLDTPKTLPEFANKKEYMKYMETVSVLPKGFSIGTADGTFVSKEAPGLGNLKIRGTVIYLTEGATEHWAAVFTQNKVRITVRVERMHFHRLDQTFDQARVTHNLPLYIVFSFLVLPL